MKSLKRCWGFGKAVFHDYSEDNGSLVAAAVSFYIFLSLVPILLLCIAVVGFLLGSPERAEIIVLSAIKSTSPQLTSQGGMDAVRSVVDEIIAGRGVATGIGLAVLLWVGTSVIASLDQAINVAWGVRQRKFLHKRLLALGVLAMMLALLGISFVITAIMTARSIHILMFGIKPTDWPWVWQFMGYLVPMALSVGTFTIFYKVIPNTHVPWKTALVAGAFTGTMWEIAKHVFGYYATHFTDYSAVYGSLAGIIVLLIWIYYSAILIIMGAEVGSVYAGRRNA